MEIAGGRGVSDDWAESSTTVSCVSCFKEGSEMEAKQEIPTSVLTGCLPVPLLGNPAVCEFSVSGDFSC